MGQPIKSSTQLSGISPKQLLLPVRFERIIRNDTQNLYNRHFCAGNEPGMLSALLRYSLYPNTWTIFFLIISL